MRRFLLRRLFFILISLMGATLFIFSLSRVGPDPRYLYIPETGGVGIQEEQWERLGRELGLDKPVYIQYFIWLGDVLTGDLGESIGTLRPVSTIIAEKAGATMTLALGAWIFAILVGVPIGVLASVKRASPWDYSGRLFALFGQALPQFWTGVMAILLFAVILEWLPPGTKGDYQGFPLAWGNVQYYILPSIVLGWPAAAGIMRLTRSSMLEILDSEFIKLARAKGVSGGWVVWKHALRNAVIPPLTSAFVLIAGWLNGALVIETVFSWPGLGWVALNRAVYQNDWPLLVGTVLLFMGLFLFFAFLADVLYAYIDPRIRYQ
jgi:peptide/nickel transport system permease protein